MGASPEAAPRARIEATRVRMTFYDQYGRGYQSKAGPPEGPGDERLMVWQPAASVTIRQRDRRFSHVVGVSADIVTAASPDALDAVSSASRWNEAVTVTTTSQVEPRGDTGRWAVSYGIHVEEHWRTALGGLGYTRSLWEGMTTLATNVNVIVDNFDDLHPRGWNEKQAYRLTLNHNVSWAQVLSETTLMALDYGLTFQQGTIENGWNSVYVDGAPSYGCPDDAGQLPEYDCENRRRENLPRTRTRHAFAAALLQHVPRTRSSLRLRYRHYRDDFQLRAHTASLHVYQWLVPRRVYLRLGYRLHHQTGVGYYTQAISVDFPEEGYATADSDLAPFWAHEGSAKLVVYLRPLHSTTRATRAVDLGYTRYQRSNDLVMNVFSVGFNQGF